MVHRYCSVLTICHGETVIPSESQLDEMHYAKFRNTKEQSIVIYYFKSNIPPILGGLSNGKEPTMPLTEIRNPGLWNVHDGVRGVYPREYKYLQYQCLNFQSVIERELVRHMEARLLASELLGK